MPPSPPPRGNRRLMWVLLALVCVLTVIAVALAVALVRGERREGAQSPTTTSASPTPAGRAPVVPDSALDGLLPDKGFVSSAVGSPGIDVVLHGETVDAEDLMDAECQGVVSVSSRVYLGSGWTAIRWQHWNNPPEITAPKLTNHVSLSVTTYPAANAARAFYVKQSDSWRKCAGHIVNGHLASAKEIGGQIWIIGEVTASDRVLATHATNFNASSWSCETMLTVRNNVAVRVTVCGYSPPDAAVRTLVDTITRKVDAAS